LYAQDILRSSSEIVIVLLFEMKPYAFNTTCHYWMGQTFSGLV